jgi:hypothetical protein
LLLALVKECQALRMVHLTVVILAVPPQCPVRDVVNIQEKKYASVLVFGDE